MDNVLWYGRVAHPEEVGLLVLIVPVVASCSCEKMLVMMWWHGAPRRGEWADRRWFISRCTVWNLPVCAPQAKLPTLVPHSLALSA